MDQAFDFGNANEEQRRAITTTEGPVLITAGPGTGKTFTLVKRVAYLILKKHVKPSTILVATFTEKAAKELVTRISSELEDHGVNFDAEEMYVGTFHSICLRLIKEHVEFSQVRRNYRVADSFDQQHLVYQNLWNRFKKLPHFADFPLQRTRAWDTCEKICTVSYVAAEELLDVDTMIASADPGDVACGEVIEEYNDILAKYNWLDFARIQLEALRLLEFHPEVLTEMTGQIRYVMIDEYQDTNFIQERLTLILGGGSGNVCVVGDDDQALYRFRSATVRNILEFPGHFDSCTRIDLTSNYRSDPGIVAFYNEWMKRTAGPPGPVLRFCAQPVETHLSMPAIDAACDKNDCRRCHDEPAQGDERRGGLQDDEAHARGIEAERRSGDGEEGADERELGAIVGQVVAQDHVVVVVGIQVLHGWPSHGH